MEKDQKSNFVKGFAHGYELERLDCEVASILAEGLGQENEYSNGLKSGMNRYREDLRLKEKMKEMEKQFEHRKTKNNTRER
jgi:hypothetical protein